MLLMGYQTHCARLLGDFHGFKSLPEGKQPILPARWIRGRCKPRTNVVVSMDTSAGNIQVSGMAAKVEVGGWESMNGAYAEPKQAAAQPIYGVRRQQFDVQALLRRIRACSSPETLAEGIRIHRSIAYTEMEADVHVGSALIEMYGKFGCLEDALSTLERISDRNVDSWTAMIKALVQNGRDRAASQAFSQMQWEGFLPSKDTLMIVLDACNGPVSLAQGKLLHSLIVESGLDSDMLVLSGLIRMYGRCRNLDTSQEIFERLPTKDVEIWNAMIAAYGMSDQSKKALELFDQMLQEGVEPNKGTMVSILQVFVHPNELADGKLMHSQVIERGFFFDIDVGNALMDMYIKCGCVDAAILLFERIPQKDLSSWNILLHAFANQENSQGALDLFARMKREGIQGNANTYAQLFDACSNSAFLAEGKQIHTSIFATEWERDVVVCSALVKMYGKCSELDDARQIFDRMRARDVLLWNSMISAYARNGEGRKAFQLHDSMQKEGIRPNKQTFLNLLNIIVDPSYLAKGKFIHSHIIQNEYDSDIAIGTALISMYGNCEDLQCALEVFEKMPERDITTWNAMIAACAQVGVTPRALELFQQMPHEGFQHDKMTFVSVLGACSCPEMLVEGRKIHSLIRDNGLELDVVVCTSLIDMYSRCGSHDEARQLFHKLPQRDVAAWNAIISTYARQGNPKDALRSFEQMQQEGLKPDRITFVNLLSSCTTASSLDDGKLIEARVTENGFETDVVVGTALVDMYGRCGTPADARHMFDKLSQRDTSTWNTMMKIYRQREFIKEALVLFKQMQLEGGRPNRTTLLGVFDVCSKLQVLTDSKLISTRLDDYEVDLDLEVGNVMLNMFVKCGGLQEAKETFDKIPNRDATTWSTLIAAYAQQGRNNVALQLFAQMQQEGIKPSQDSLVSVLTAISNMGPLEEICDYFNSTIFDEGMQKSVQQCGAMVNLLGQKGHLDEAESFIAKTPYKDNKAMWMALLGACKVHGDVDRGQRIAEQLLQLDPQTSAPYVMLSNLYASAGRWEAKARVRKVMADKGIRKKPGISAVEVQSKMHEFVVRDRSHPKTKEIYAELDRLTAEIKKAGYVHDTSQVLHNVSSQEEKEFLLNTHSERLAICYGLISTPHGSPLRIIKNLRVCPDCHVATKFICKVTERDIVVRDGKRFHHFSKDGTCSCNDYW